MRIADQLVRPGYVGMRVGGEREPGMGARVSPIIRKAVRVNAQVASELYYRGKQNNYSLTSDFGSLMLPYPLMWMEWKWPSILTIDGKESPAPQEIYEGVVMRQEFDDDGSSVISSQLFMQTPGSPVVVVEAIDHVLVDSFGKFVNRKCQVSDSLQQDTVNVVSSNLNTAYLAVSLMNCKNVDVEVAGTIKARRSGSAKRRKEPNLEYHTINLPGTSRRDATSSSNEDVMALHRARGHFKTYTAERPLLGKHVGTYWWGWQVRGNKKNGITVTDYKVGVAE